MKNRSLTHRKLKIDDKSPIHADGEAHPADLGHQMCYVLEGDGVSFGDRACGGCSPPPLPSSGVWGACESYYMIMSLLELLPECCVGP